MSESDEAEQVKALIENWAAAVRAQDIEGVLKNHASDIVVYDVIPPLQLSGLTAYRKSWAEQFFPWAKNNGRFEITNLSVTAGKTVAFANGLIQCAGTENNKKVETTVRLTLGLEKRNGEWFFVHEHHSEPVKYES